MSKWRQLCALGSLYPHPDINSAKALNKVVGHEITHVLEGTELYDALQDAVIKYAQSKGEYDSRLQDITELYKKHDPDADPVKELTADLVGDYLFTDTEFINNLSTNHRNVVQKIYDEIKYLCKVATAGSKEARQLEKVKKAFEQAYRADNKAQTNSKAQNSISETTDGRFVAVVDNDILSNIDTSTWDKTTKKQAQKAASKELKKFADGFTINGIELVGNKDTRDEYTRSNYSEALADKNPASYLDKMRSAAILDDVIQVATEWKNDNGLKYDREDYVDFVRGNTLIKSGDSTYRAVVLAGITSDGKSIFYDVVDIYPESFELKKSESYTAVSANELPNAILKDSDADTLTQGNPVVKKQFSLSDSTDSVSKPNPSTDPDIQFSLSEDTSMSDKAIAKNVDLGFVPNATMESAKALREFVANRLRSMKENGVAIPDDIKGNTAISNSSYDITEENTTICPRSLASEAFTDAVSEYLGRPLTVEEQIYISQDLQSRSLTPECVYCYVATDRKAYRAFLGEYVKQRDSVIKKLADNPNTNVSRSGDLYKEFLNGRKDTEPMYKRFKMWVDSYKNGTPMIDASHLANIDKLMGDINSEFGAELKPQIVDAMKYAQSASWAKKRVSYVAYDGHILKWKQNRIDKLNSHYGLRMYSFSDFHPAFVLENMQMITDASVRGLKMLGYTKDIDFVDIFAPTGMNINVSTFGFESGGNVYENNIIGAEWEKAKALRDQHPNVGVTFVATNDTLVEWALAQDWIDVVIPYHLVRTGTEVAKAFNFHNYTDESSDVKDVGWDKGTDKKYIAPTEHNNDKATYLAALAKNHLKPRFERFIGNPNYMKLVNECRQPASESQPVQPKFNEEAIDRTLARLQSNGYYQPIGGSVERMYEIAAEVAENMTQDIGPVMSLSNIGKADGVGGNYNVYGKDIALPSALEDIAPVREDIAPIAEDAPATKAIGKPIGDYPAGKQSVLRSYLAAADDSIKQFAQRVKAGDLTFKRQKISDVSDRAAGDIGEILNIDVSGYTHNINTHGMQHIINRHGENGKQDTSMAMEDDIARIGWVLENYDSVNLMTENGAQVYSSEFLDTNHSPAPRIRFVKKIDGTYYVVETAFENDYKKLWVQSAYLQKNEDVTQTPAEGMTTNHETNAQSASASPSSSNTIAGDTSVVKDEDTIPAAQTVATEQDSKAEPNGKERKWVGTSTESEVVDGKILPEDLDQDLIHYQPISNKKTLGNANTKLNSMGYETSVSYLNSQFANNRVRTTKKL